MASKTQIFLIDDVDGSEASETIEFGMDGVEYEIDLNDEHAEALRGAVAAWVEVARRTGTLGGGRRTEAGPHRPAGKRKVSSAGADGGLSREERGHLRTWAANNGFAVSDRGRIAAEVHVAWDSAGRPEQ